MKTMMSLEIMKKHENYLIICCYLNISKQLNIICMKVHVKIVEMVL